MIDTAMKVGRLVGGTVWKFAKSENALAIIKVAATFVHSVEELRKANRIIGFRVRK